MSSLVFEEPLDEGELAHRVEHLGWLAISE
jgi:hypothetical protein